MVIKKALDKKKIRKINFVGFSCDVKKLLIKSKNGLFKVPSRINFLKDKIQYIEIEFIFLVKILFIG